MGSVLTSNLSSCTPIVPVASKGKYILEGPVGHRVWSRVAECIAWTASKFPTWVRHILVSIRYLRRICMFGCCMTDQLLSTRSSNVEPSSMRSYVPKKKLTIKHARRAVSLSMGPLARVVGPASVRMLYPATHQFYTVNLVWAPQLVI